MMDSARLLKLLLAGLVMACSAAHAQYPERPITLIVPYAAGSGSGDRVARLVSPRLAERLGVNVVVDNRPGADGAIAMAVINNAKADGYTLMMGDTGMLAVAPAMRKVNYDPAKLSPIGPVNANPHILAVNPALGARSVAELVKLSKTRPGGLDFASTYAVARIGIELLKKSTGIDVTIVPFAGSAPGMNSVISGQTSMLLGVPLGVKPFIDSGQLVAIAMAAPARSPILPNVPTFDELGVPGFHLESTIGMYAPNGTSREVVERLNRALTLAMSDPALLKELAGMGTNVPAERSVEAFSRRTAQERQQWHRIAAESGIAEMN